MDVQLYPEELVYSQIYDNCDSSGEYYLVLSDVLVAIRQLSLPVITSMAIFAFIAGVNAGLGPGKFNFLYGIVY